MKHYEECKTIWLQKFNAVYPGPEVDIIKYAEFPRSVVPEPDQRIVRTIAEQIIELNQKIKFALKKGKYEFAVMHLIKYAQEDERGCNFYHMFEDYLAKPCKYYLESFGYPILFQAQFDFGVKSFHSVLFEMGERAEVLQFYQSMAYARACERVIEGGFDFKQRAEAKWISLTRMLGAFCDDSNQKLPLVDYKDENKYEDDWEF